MRNVRTACKSAGSEKLSNPLRACTVILNIVLQDQWCVDLFSEIFYHFRRDMRPPCKSSVN